MKRIVRYLIHTQNFGIWYPKRVSFNLVGYYDSDYAGDKVDIKSTSGTYLSISSWISCILVFQETKLGILIHRRSGIHCAGSCCAQLLWMTETLKDYGIYVKYVPLLCDNESAIKISHNPVQHSRTKHIEIRHHFIQDHVAKGHIKLKHVRTDKKFADIFTKPLDEKVFCRLRVELNIIDASNLEYELHLIHARHEPMTNP